MHKDSVSMFLHAKDDPVSCWWIKRELQKHSLPGMLRLCSTVFGGGVANWETILLAVWLGKTKTETTWDVLPSFWQQGL